MIGTNSPLPAHPGHGIAVDSNKNLYFTDISRQTIWKIPPEGLPQPLITNTWSHPLFINAKDEIFVAHEEFLHGTPNYILWKINENGSEIVLLPQKDRKDFDGSTFVIDPAGNIYFSYENYRENKYYIMQRQNKGRAKIFAGGKRGHKDGKGKKAKFNGFRAMAMRPNGAIYVADVDAVRKITPEGVVSTIASGLLEENPKDLPFQHENPSTANRLYGLVVDNDGSVYVAYYGNRLLLKIEPDGTTLAVYRSEKPWSPVGVALDGSDVYILESGLEPGSKTPGPRVRKLSPDMQITTIIVIK